jgi:ABC-2 type transport system ATP-binding protein
MAVVMTAMAEDGVSVLLSSHVLAELERVADYLVLISRGRVRIAGAVEELLSEHRLLTGPSGQSPDPHWRTVQNISAGAQQHLLVETPADVPAPRGWEARSISLEELTMAYLREDAQASRPAPLEILR